MAENLDPKLEKDNQQQKRKNIDWGLVLKALWDVRKQLIIIAIGGAIVGLMVGISLPKRYSVSVTLSPEVGNTKSGGSLASLASSFLGNNMLQNGPDALSAVLAPDIVSSTPFLLELLESRVEIKENKIDTSLSAYLETESKPWWVYVIQAPNYVVSKVRQLFQQDNEENYEEPQFGTIILRPKDNAKIQNLRRKISAFVEPKRRIITLRVSLQNPLVTAVVADSVVNKLQKYIVNYKTSKAKSDCSYWEKLYKTNKQQYYNAQQRYAQFVDANTNVIFQSTLIESERLKNEMLLAYQLYTHVSEQFEMAKAKVQESKPAFTVIEPAVVPFVSLNISKLKLMFFYSILAISSFLIWNFYCKKLIKEFRQLIKKCKSCNN